MFINYEHETHVYPVTVERRENQFYIMYDNNEYTVEATELKQGQLTIQLGDRVIKAVISGANDNKFVFIEGNVFKVRRIELTGRMKTEKKEGDLNSPISGTVVSVKVKEGKTGRMVFVSFETLHRNQKNELLAKSKATIINLE